MFTRRGKVFELLNRGNNKPKFTFYKHCHILQLTWFPWQPCRINRTYFPWPHLIDDESEAPWDERCPWQRATPHPAPCRLHRSSSESRAASLAEGTEEARWQKTATFDGPVEELFKFMFFPERGGCLTPPLSPFTISVMQFAFMLINDTWKCFENNVMF